MRPKFIGFILLIVLALILDQCSSAKRDDSGSITNAGDVGAFEIQRGDCFDSLPNFDADGGTFSSLNAVPCNEAHHWEVFYQDSISLSSFADDAVREEASAICNSATERLITTMSSIKYDAFQSAELTYFAPTSKSWNSAGDRAVDCLIGSDVDTYFTSAIE